MIFLIVFFPCTGNLSKTSILAIFDRSYIMFSEFLNPFFLIFKAKRSKIRLFWQIADYHCKTKNFRHFSFFCEFSRFSENLLVCRQKGPKSDKKMTVFFDILFVHRRKINVKHEYYERLQDIWKMRTLLMQRIYFHFPMLE